MSNDTNTNTKTATPTFIEKKAAAFKEYGEMGNFLNMTPHPIKLNDGREFAPCGIVARVEDEFGPIVDGCCTVSRGKVKFFQDGEEYRLTAYDVELYVCIVSAMVLEETRNWTSAVFVAPATGHPETVRNEKGHIVSVPCFVL